MCESMTKRIICFFSFVISSFSVRKGGPNPVSNTVLATILEKAKDLDVPKDIVERNIKRASEKGQEDFIEKIYEVYISHKLQTLVFVCFKC